MTLTLTKTKVALAAIIAAAALLLSPVAFAHDGKHDGDKNHDKRGNNGLHLGSWFKTRLDLNGDGEISKEEKQRKFAAWRSHITAGTITNINGSVFTIDPVGKKATTTVTINSDTDFKGGDRADLEVGGKVVVVGTTTAQSADGDSFTASLVKLFANGWGKIGLWFGLR